MKTLCRAGRDAPEVICVPVNGPEMFNETASGRELYHLYILYKELQNVVTNLK
jgi:hypothetical protein